MADAHDHTGHAINPLTYALDTARDVLYEGMEPPTNAYSRDVDERRSQQVPWVQHQPLLSTKHIASSHQPLDHHFSEPDRANDFEIGALPPAPRAAMEPWSDRAFEHQI